MALDGDTTLSPPVPREKDGRQMRCPMLKPWVTEDREISTTFEMLVALGVVTKNDCPYPMIVGTDVIVGRVPLKR